MVEAGSKIWLISRYYYYCQLSPKSFLSVFYITFFNITQFFWACILNIWGVIDGARINFWLILQDLQSPTTLFYCQKIGFYKTAWAYSISLICNIFTILIFWGLNYKYTRAELEAKYNWFYDIAKHDLSSSPIFILIQYGHKSFFCQVCTEYFYVTLVLRLVLEILREVWVKLAKKVD